MLARKASETPHMINKLKKVQQHSALQQFKVDHLEDRNRESTLLSGLQGLAPANRRVINHKPPEDGVTLLSSV